VFTGGFPEITNLTVLIDLDVGVGGLTRLVIGMVYQLHATDITKLFLVLFVIVDFVKTLKVVGHFNVFLTVVVCGRV
jgi:hypothetical protein